METLTIMYALGLWALKWWPAWLAIGAVAVHHLMKRKAK